VPSSCRACSVEGCSGTNSACTQDATCAACRNVDFTASACLSNAAFVAFRTCVCALGCASCAPLCADAAVF
jgi:hypothetical protein